MLGSTAPHSVKWRNKRDSCHKIARVIAPVFTRVVVIAITP